MKKLFITIFLIPNLLLIYSQKFSIDTISNDELLELFQTNNPFNVIKTFQINQVIDNKAVYFDNEVKEYIMQLLDKQEYVKYILNKDSIKFIQDTTALNRAIYSYLLESSKVEIYDSVLNTTEIYKSYIDTIIKLRTKIYSESINSENISLPDEVIWLHAKIAYPESYRELHKMWESENFTISSQFFIPLVKLRDPLAIKKYDQLIKQFIKSNGESYYFMDMYNNLKRINNSYSTRKLLKLIEFNMEFEWFSEGEEIYSFNCMVVSLLQSVLWSLEYSSANNYFKGKDCKEVLKDKKLFKEKTLEFIQIMENEEKYWKENIDYKFP